MSGGPAPAHPSRLPSPVTLDVLVGTLSAACPGLALGEPLQLIEGFEKWIVAAPEWVARFPKTDDAAVAMEREQRLLVRLAGRITTGTPRPLRIRPDFDVCTRAPGRRMWDGREEWWRTWPADRQRRCAHELGVFIAELQRALSVDDARALGCAAPLFPYSATELASRLAGRLGDPESERFLERTLRDYGALRVAANDLAVLHNDLIPHNLLADPETGALTAVVDFGDVCIGDRHQELQYLPGFGRTFIDEAVERYEESAGRPLSRPRIDLYHAVALLSHIAFAMEDPIARELERKRGWIRALARTTRAGSSP